MTAYVLTSAAEADLRGIVRYTRDTWGEAQARRYIATLARSLEALATGKGGFRNISALYPGLRMARCEQHYAFCLPRAEAPALIVAILHSRMDLMARVAARLGE